MSLTGPAGHLRVREPVRGFLDGTVPPQLLDDTITVAGELVRDALQHTGGAELILSRRDDAILIEVVDRDPRPRRMLSSVTSRARICGTNRLGAGTVVWAEMPRSAPADRGAGEQEQHGRGEVAGQRHPAHR
jgi:hypothetical protein